MLFYRITEFSKAYPAGIEADINTNDPRTTCPCYTTSMGTALYKALREAGVSDETATAAADDAGQTERLQRMEERLTRVEVTMRVLVGLAVAILVLQLQPFLS